MAREISLSNGDKVTIGKLKMGQLPSLFKLAGSAAKAAPKLKEAILNAAQVSADDLSDSAKNAAGIDTLLAVLESLPLIVETSYQHLIDAIHAITGYSVEGIEKLTLEGDITEILKAFFAENSLSEIMGKLKNALAPRAK